MARTKIGIFKFSCCAGCEYQLLYVQDHLEETLKAVDVVYCMMVGINGDNQHGPFDIALVEGAITESWQVDELKRIRESSKYLIPMGSCAVDGGIPSIKDRTPEFDVERRVYKDTSVIHSIKAHPIDEYVTVDDYIRGCPIDQEEILEFLSSLLIGKKPVQKEYAVCVECKLKGNTCVLIAKNEPCMGPVTVAGCGALLPSHGRACIGCRGPMKGANASALAGQFEKMGLAARGIPGIHRKK